MQVNEARDASESKPETKQRFYQLFVMNFCATTACKTKRQEAQLKKLAASCVAYSSLQCTTVRAVSQY